MPEITVPIADDILQVLLREAAREKGVSVEELACELLYLPFAGGTHAIIKRDNILGAGWSGRFPPPPGLKQLAQLLGLTDYDLTTARRLGDHFVYSIWHFEIHLSFRPHSILAGVSAGPAALEAPQTQRIVFATCEESAILSLDECRDPPISLGLLQSPKNIGGCDGVHYRMVFQSNALACSFDFGNVQTPDLKKIVRFMFGLAKKAAEESRKASLIAAVKEWRVDLSCEESH